MKRVQSAFVQVGHIIHQRLMGLLARHGKWARNGHHVDILITGVLAEKPSSLSLIRTVLAEVECIVANTEIITIEA